MKTKRLFDSVRSGRPNITCHQKNPLAERFSTDGRFLTREEFGRFFTEACKSRRPKENPSLGDIYAFAFRPFRSTDTNPSLYFVRYDAAAHTLPLALGVASSMRSYLLWQGISKDLAGPGALDIAEALLESPFLTNLLFRNGTEENAILAAHLSLEALPLKTKSKAAFHDELSVGFLTLKGLIQILSSSADPHPETLLPLSASDQMRVALQGTVDFPPRPFHYPHFPSRLFALLGDAFFYSGGDRLRVDAIRNLFNDREIPKRLYAAIVMYPWEPDLIDKARKIMSLGIPCAKPLGKLFIGDIELAVFKWVKGDTLDTLPDLRVWRLFGKTLRRCHELGVCFDDAAGRNAVFDGKKIVLLDFEHTRIKPGCRPLNPLERECSVGRVTEELELKRDPELLRAFGKGYAG